MEIIQSYQYSNLFENLLFFIVPVMVGILIFWGCLINGTLPIKRSLPFRIIGSSLWVGILIVLLVGMLTSKSYLKNRIEVRISDGTSFNYIYENYEIISEENGIFILEEK